MYLIGVDVSGRVERSERAEPAVEAAHRHSADVTANLLAHIRLRKLVEYLELHPSSRLTTAAAAKVVYFQENYFCALFKRETGATFVNWQRTWRVTRIADLLLSEKISITRAAERYGYVSMRTFERAFKSVYGVSAREFRRVRQNRVALAASEHHNGGQPPSGTCSECCIDLSISGSWSRATEEQAP